MGQTIGDCRILRDVGVLVSDVDGEDVGKLFDCFWLSLVEKSSETGDGYWRA
jgi:hypothetical protein